MKKETYHKKAGRGGREKKGRQGVESAFEILCGIHPVLEALKVGKRRFFEIAMAKGRSAGRLDAIMEMTNRQGIPLRYEESDTLDTLSLGVKHQGVVAKVSSFPLHKAEALLKSGALDLPYYSPYLSQCKGEFSPVSSPSASISFSQKGAELPSSSPSSSLPSAGRESGRFFLILEGVEDPHNLGAIIRTALCSGVDRIFLPKDRAVHPSPSVSRASAGAMEHADISVITNTATFLKGLKKKGVWIAGLDADGETSLFQADFSGDIALVIGGEHSGIRPLVKKECDFIVSLPMVHGVTSLNASVACGIAMYEVLRQRSMAS